MAVSAVSQKGLPQLVDRAGGTALRDQMKLREHAFKARENAALGKARTPQARKALDAEFKAAALERAHDYAAMICSQEDWSPKPGCSVQGNVLTSFYRLMGQKARAHAASEGRLFTLDDLRAVKLDEHDIAGLRKQFSDADIKKAWPLLDKHIVHGRFLSHGAQRFMKSGRFLAYQTALMVAEDRMEKGIEHHREKLDDKAAQSLRDDRRATQKRQFTHLTDEVIVERDRTHQEKTTYAVVGNRLVPVDEKPE